VCIDAAYRVDAAKCVLDSSNLKALNGALTDNKAQNDPTTAALATLAEQVYKSQSFNEH
jgi:hypothetical protein